MDTETRCAIYARKSTVQSKAEDDRSVDRQVANARAFAEASGWRVLDDHVYTDDGISGAETKKLVAKRQMLEVVASGRAPFQAIVMQSNDRLSRRDGVDAVVELRDLASHGIAVWFYADGTQFRYGNFADNTLGFLRGEFAAEYRRDVRRKTIEALTRRAQRGLVVGGRVFGYDNCRGPHGVERVINPAEAAVVRRIFREYAEGAGLRAIAHGLNADGVAAPRAQQGRVTGWCPSSLRSVLRRPLYSGVILHNTTVKRPDELTVKPKPRPAAEHIRLEVPALAIVDAATVRAVNARFEWTQARLVRNERAGGRPAGRVAAEGSRYLLTGMLRCGVCGGSMEVVSSTCGSARSFVYRCSVARRKGPACCRNLTPAPMAATDARILREVGKALLARDVVARAIEIAVAELTEEAAGDPERARLEADLATVTSVTRRLTAAIAAGGELDPLLEALREAQARRETLQRALDARRTRHAAPAAADVRQRLETYLGEWETLLAGNIGQAQQALRRLVVDKLVLTPTARGGYTFVGTGTLEPVLAGAIGGSVLRMASPAGFEPASPP